MKPVGTIKIEEYVGDQKNTASVEAFRIGKYWAVNRAGHSDKYYNLTHVPTGRSLTTYVGIRQARRLVGVLDVLFPFQTDGEIGQVWKTLSEKTKSVLRG